MADRVIQTPSRSRSSRTPCPPQTLHPADGKPGPRASKEITTARAQLLHKDTELETLREQVRELTDELAWVVQDLLRLKKKDNDDRCQSWLLSSQGLSTVLAKHQNTQKTEGDTIEVQSELSEATVNQLNESRMFQGPTDGALLEELEQHAGVLPAGLSNRVRDALYQSRADAYMLRARVLRMESEQMKANGHTTDCKPIKDDSAQYLHQSAERIPVQPDMARRQTESTGPIELIAVASISAASHHSIQGVQAATPGGATRGDHGGAAGGEGIASVLLREREVQRELEACQVALQESQREQQVLAKKAEAAENAQRAAESKQEQSTKQAQDRMQEVMQRMVDMEASAAELREDAEATRAALDKSSAEAEAAQEQVQMLRAARLQAETEAAEMVGRVEEAEEKLRSAQAALQERRLEAETLLAEKEALAAKLATAEAATSSLEERCKQSQGAVGTSSAECQRLQALLTKRENRVAELIAQADELTASRLEAQTHRDAAQAAQRDSAAQLSGAEGRAAKAAAAAEAAEHSAELLKAEVHSEKAKVTAAEQQCSEKASALAKCEAQCQDLQRQLSALLEEQEGLRTAQGRVEELEEKLQQETARADGLQAHADRAQQEAEEIRQQASNRQAALNQELATQTSIVAQTRASCDDAIAALADMEKERDAAVAETNEQRRSNSTLSEKLRTAQTKAQNLKAESDRLQTQLRGSETSKEKLETQLDGMRQRVAELQRTAESNRTYRCRAEAAEQQIADSNRALCTLQEELQALRGALQESQGKAATASAAARKAKEALREEQEKHSTCQDTCTSLQADVQKITAALEDAVKTLQDLRSVNEKDRAQRQQAEHAAHIAEAHAAEAAAQAEAATARAAAARAVNREDEKEELLRDFADQVQKLEQQSAQQVQAIRQLQEAAREHHAAMARQGDRLARTDGELARVRLANRKLKGEYLEQTALLSGHGIGPLDTLRCPGFLHTRSLEHTHTSEDEAGNADCAQGSSEMDRNASNLNPDSNLNSNSKVHDGNALDGPYSQSGQRGAGAIKDSVSRRQDHVDARQLQYLTGKIRSIVRCLKLNWKPPPNGLTAAAASAAAFVACIAGFLGALEAAALSHIGRTHDLATWLKDRQVSTADDGDSKKPVGRVRPQENPGNRAGASLDRSTLADRPATVGTRTRR